MLGFRQVDVFSPVRYGGNPLAVVADADGLDEATMQGFAAWTNLSETTFLLTPTDPAADYRVRIFTPSRELPFAGHPTLGSASAWLAAGGAPKGGRLVQECGLGLVEVRMGYGPAGDELAFAAPPLRRYEPLTADEVATVAAGLRIGVGDILAARWLVNGPEWVGVRLADAEAVLALTPDGPALDGWDVGVVGPRPAGHQTAIEVRAFVGGDPLVEDPVTGSLQAGLAEWLLDDGLVDDSYLAAQGTALGRTGRVRVERDGDQIWIGGRVNPGVAGTVDLGRSDRVGLG